MFGVVVGAASLYGGCRLLARDIQSAARQRGPFLNQAIRGPNIASGLFFAALGAILIILVAMAAVGPWREREPGPFPMHILDLTAPPAAIERVPPPPAADERRPER